jgi:hypothetical protein
MHRANISLLALGAAALAVAVTGCSGGGPVLDTEYVEGVVTLDDKPVAGATVRFQPVTQGQGMSAYGTTDENGVYKLTAAVTGETTAEPEAGTLPGEYYVGVEKTTVESPMSQEEAEEKGVEWKPPEEGKEAGTTTYVIPQKYNTPKESGLKKTVKAGEKNNIPLKLTSE